jgi:hypothetical protein
MSKNIASILAFGLLGSIFSFNVQAFPLSSPPPQVAAPEITLVRGFCGIGFHRAYGYCVRNGTPYVYPPPVVVAPVVCPYGYQLGPYGRCYPY